MHDSKNHDTETAPLNDNAFDAPLFVYDLETTSAEPSQARICQIAARLYDGQTMELIDDLTALVNPEAPITPGASEVHGITNEQVAGCRPFRAYAPVVADMLRAEPILVGFNNRAFDDPILEREMKRAGDPVDLAGLGCYDVYKLYRKLYPATLSGITQRLLGVNMEAEAHDAAGDAKYTLILLKHLLHYHDQVPRDAGAINEWLYPDYVDREGKLRRDDNGAVCFTFGKLDGKPLAYAAKHERGYLEWMLGRDFPDDLKRIITEALKAENPASL